jgi:type II secretory pathway pseudopilin PulG
MLADQAGFTLIEALVAALLVSIGSLAVMGGFDGARRATFRAEQSQVATDRAQRELEAIRALDYSQIALTAAPGTSADPADPRSRVSAGTFRIDRDGTESAPLVIEGGTLEDGETVTGSAVDPGPDTFTSGDVTGTIHRFVVWRDDPSCLPLVCPGEQDMKRVIVAIALDPTASGGARDYVEVHTDVTDPQDSVISDTDLPDLGVQTVAQQFWLSDERCKDTGEPAHSGTLASHSVHDTRGGNCRDATTDRPDALVTTAPENLDITPDYATNVEPGGSDAGLQFQAPSSGGCPFKPTTADGDKQAHVWVTPKLGLNFQMTGGATLELWTRTIDDAIAPGELCVTLFTRTEVLSPLGAPLDPIDTRIPDANNPANLYFTASRTTWPRGNWETIRIPMNFAPAAVAPGSRLGVQVGLRGGGTTSDDLMFHYDQVELESRLEVETTTPLP